MIFHLALALLQPGPELTIRNSLLELHKQGAFRACNAAVALPNGKVWTFAIGTSDEKGTPLKPSDRMLSGSIGKTYFMAEFLREWTRRGWGLDEPIRTWVGNEPWFEWLPGGPQITPRMLLNHSACLPEYFEIESAMEELNKSPLRAWTVADRLRHLKGQTSRGQVGKDFSYADTHYIVLAALYEKATGTNMTRQMERNLLHPLQLTGTIPSHRVAVRGLIAGYSTPLPPFTFKGPMVVKGKMLVNPQFEWGGGGFANTAESLARWQVALQTGKVLGPDLTKQMHTGIPANTGRDHQYGLGCQIRPYSGGLSYGHSGWFPGYLSDSAYFPKEGIAVAVQFNTDNMRSLKKNPYRYLTDILQLVTGK